MRSNRMVRVLEPRMDPNIGPDGSNWGLVGLRWGLVAPWWGQSLTLKAVRSFDEAPAGPGWIQNENV